MLANALVKSSATNKNEKLGLKLPKMPNLLEKQRKNET